MTQSNLEQNPQEFYFQALNKSLKVVCQDSQQDLEATIEVLNETFKDMERLYELKYKSSSSALDTSTWLLIGALNLAHRVVCLEREAALHTQNLEIPLSKLLDSIPDDVIPNDSTTGFNRLLPME